MDRAPAVSIVIVTYNSRQHIPACLDSIRARTPRIPYEILLVDNASPDGTAGLVAERYPEVKLTALRRNSGFAAACNLAAQTARGDLLLFLNPDTRLMSDAVLELARLCREPDGQGEQVICGASLVDGQGATAKSSGQFPRAWQQTAKSFKRSVSLVLRAAGFGRARAGAAADGREYHEVPFVSGASLMIPRSLFNALGGFDERFFMYAEESDLQYRAARHGVRRLVAHRAAIYHAEGASISVPIRRWVMLETSYRRFMEKHESRLGYLIALGPLTIARLVEAVCDWGIDRDGKALAAKAGFVLRLAFRWKHGRSYRDYGATP